MSYSSHQSGFTLVEIIIVISIMGIIGGLSALIIGRSLDSYAALERREKLQTSVRFAVERMSRELRNALPNSVCINNGGACIVGAGSGSQFYFIPVKSSGRYQDRPGAYTAPPPIQRDPLPVNQNRDRFDVLSTNGANRLDAVQDDWVAVANPNFTDIYAGINNIRHSINAIVQKDIENTAGTADDIDQIQFTGNVSFNDHSLTRRFHIIDDNQQVTLFSLVGSNLFRDTTLFNAPNNAANPQLLMEDVIACTFTFSPGTPQTAGLLRIDITVERQNERIQVIHNAQIYNTP